MGRNSAAIWGGHRPFGLNHVKESVMAKKTTKKKTSTQSPSKDGWTTMYLPKENVPDMIAELQELLQKEMPYDVAIPKYKVLELALAEAIERRKGK